MNKHDDSEFKLPNEDKSMKPKILISLEVNKDEPYGNEFVSDFNKDIIMSEDTRGKNSKPFELIC